MADTESKSGLDFLKDWGGGLTNWTEKWIPDALVIVWILTVIGLSSPSYGEMWGPQRPSRRGVRASGSYLLLQCRCASS